MVLGKLRKLFERQKNVLKTCELNKCTKHEYTKIHTQGTLFALNFYVLILCSDSTFSFCSSTKARGDLSRLREIDKC